MVQYQVGCFQGTVEDLHTLRSNHCQDLFRLHLYQLGQLVKRYRNKWNQAQVGLQRKMIFDVDWNVVCMVS